MQLVIRNGQIVTPNQVSVGDIGIDDGKIAAITQSGSLDRGDQEIDAAGLFVLPGAIDAHVHPYLDGWAGTLRGAAFGGVTTILFMAKYKATETVEQLLDQVIIQEPRQAIIDYSIHLVLREPFNPCDVAYARGRGITSFKVFMNHMNQEEILSDSAIFRAMREIGRQGGICLVHAEHGELIRLLRQEKQEASHVGVDAYLDVHCPLTEVMAIERAIGLAELAGCPLYLVHVTTCRGVELARHARQHQQVFAETCLPFALMTSKDLLEGGPILKITPAPRSPDDVSAIWSALNDGSLQVVSSDHAAQPANLKRDIANIFDVPSGLPSTEVLLPLLYDEGVVRRGLPLTWLTRVLSENPARIFGLAPRKGTISIGADADLVLFDPNAERHIHAADLHSLADFTPFEGKTIRGQVKATLVRGTVVMQDGEIVAPTGHGQFLSRN